MIDNTKTGIGYYVDFLIRKLGEQANGKNMHGYYFDFLNTNHKKTPIIPGVTFRKILLIPGKILSVSRRLGFQPPLELFTSTKSAGVVFYTNYVALPTIRRRKIALAVYDLSFLDCPEFTQPVNLTYLRRFCPPSINSADLIITVSEFTKQRLLYYYPDMRAEIIVTPIPPIADTVIRSDMIPERLSSLGIRATKYIFYLGTIEPRKNIKQLVESYALLPQEIRDAYSLVLAGGKGWKDKEILEAIAAAIRAGCNIIQTGYISDEEKIALYCNARCFAMPSHYEGFGMPIFEAMQYDVPVAASDIPVFREVAKDAVLYFDKDNPKDIAEKLSLLLSDEKMQEKLIQSGRERLRAYSWEESARIAALAFEQLEKKSI